MTFFFFFFNLRGAGQLSTDFTKRLLVSNPRPRPRGPKPRRPRARGHKATPGGRGGGWRTPEPAGVPAGLARRARSRTDLPGGAVPQHDDFQLPVLALLL